MSIKIETTVTLAEVEVNDEYGVTLRQRRKRIGYTPEEAERLADELRARAAEAREKLAADAHETTVHGFDIAPICRECAEGKHGACNGEAIAEDAADSVWQTRCGCFAAAHVVIGTAS